MYLSFCFLSEVSEVAIVEGVKDPSCVYIHSSIMNTFIEDKEKVL